MPTPTFFPLKKPSPNTPNSSKFVFLQFFASACSLISATTRPSSAAFSSSSDRTSRRLGVLFFGFSLLAVLVVLVTSAQTSHSNAIHFTDVTEKAGIRFTHFKGHQGISVNLEEFGPGVCVSDFDGDDWQDTYFVNGRDRHDRGISVRNALYRNNRDGSFTDVMSNAGIPGTGYGLGGIWGDYDNDGFPDRSSLNMERASSTTTTAPGPSRMSPTKLAPAAWSSASIRLHGARLCYGRRPLFPNQPRRHIENRAPQHHQRPASDHKR